MEGPGATLALSAAVAWYAVGVRRLWRAAGRGRGVSVRRVAGFAGAAAVVLLALASPLDRFADDLFAMHMVQHLLLVSVAAPLFALSAPLLPALWALPPRPRRRLARWWAWSPKLRRTAVLLTGPTSAAALHVAALALWHLRGPYDFALEHEWAHALEHASFLATACLFWWAVVQPIGRRRLGYGAGMLYVAAMAVGMGMLGAVLTFSTTPWYAGHLSTTRGWGLSPLEDQRLAGLIMWIPASVVNLGAVAWLFVNWLRADGGARSATVEVRVRNGPSQNRAGRGTRTAFWTHASHSETL